jgi:UDP-N-acetylmuramate--alanine ligase
METASIPADLSGFRVYFVGIKGTGMAALAELLHGRGARVEGSDTHERFYTDAVLKRLGIPYREGFDPSNVPDDAQLVIHSAAYDPKSHPELVEAVRQGLPLLEYTAALGELSKTAFSIGVAGVHGKTTTTAMIGTICKEEGLPAYVLVGSAVSNFGSRSTFVGGDRCFVAETCEYRRHFLSFRPDVIVVTNVDADHLDYFEDREDVLGAFVEYGRLLPDGGSLVYCADDDGACELARRLSRERGDLSLVPYGFEAEGAYRIHGYRRESGVHRFLLGSGAEGESRSKASAELELRIPGKHSVLNAAAAVAATDLIELQLGTAASEDGAGGVRRALAGFSGSKRRSEILGEAGGVIFADDYGHHPREVRGTIEGFREFYPDRRLIVDFMSHTYTRTAAFLDDFADAFASADEVILHKIYASAREAAGSVDGRTLFEKVKERHPNAGYFHEVMDAEPYLAGHLSEGDLFLTMGAGDNWRLSEALHRRFAEEEQR